MNSDPHDSAAWRTFGMLDAAGSELFEEAMRNDPELRRTNIEMDRLATAVAAFRAEPVQPAPEQLERLQRELGHSNAPRKCSVWHAVAGWGVAAALAGVLAWQYFSGSDEEPAPLPSATSAPEAPAAISAEEKSEETRRLTEEIGVLRKNLEQFHQRDRAMFQIIPGRALQIVMTMAPPGEPAADAAATTAMLGDALAAIHQDAYATSDEAGHIPPVAVPIYDATRDTGTLVVSNLPPAPRGKVYHLWVGTSPGNRPIYIGSLPDDIVSGAESFDFGLDSTMILPTAFMLTVGTAESPAPPNEENTVLASPTSSTQ